ncbi:hypothetical protein GA0115233_107828 [Streptomyces sp. DI166]|nr:hypothetical protein GA0115233_107828 [Streptomyces sp. DI166]
MSRARAEVPYGPVEDPVEDPVEGPVEDLWSTEHDH